jgi:deoxyribonuclease-4
VAALAKSLLKDDFERLRLLPGTLYNLHPGCHLGQGAEVAMEATARLLNEVYPDDGQTIVLLETMAGKGTEIGRAFEELSFMMERFKRPEMIGACLDTCHVHDAGYDVSGDLEGVLGQFDRAVGLDKIKAVHVNDSLNLLGSRKDRHAKIGQGHIGLPALAKVIGHPSLKDRPFILETPNDLLGYVKEIKLLKKAL